MGYDHIHEKLHPLHAKSHVAAGPLQFAGRLCGQAKTIIRQILSKNNGFLVQVTRHGVVTTMV